jgi:hypothetical protein
MHTHFNMNTINRSHHRPAACSRNSTRAFPARGSTLVALAACLFAIAMAAGCASTKISDREELVTSQQPRPHHIYIYDFIYSADGVPPESALAGQVIDAPAATPEQEREGKALGDQIAAELVQEIRAMGMPADIATQFTRPEVNDLILRGYFISMQQGSEAKRIAIGFGSGESELKTVVEGFQQTTTGLRKVGSGTLDSGGSKTPGAALGLATFAATANPAGLIVSSGMKIYGEESGSSKVTGRAKATAKEIAKVLKQRFQEQGWIEQQ